jgi:hypothetical protein
MKFSTKKIENFKEKIKVINKSFKKFILFFIFKPSATSALLKFLKLKKSGAR